MKKLRIILCAFLALLLSIAVLSPIPVYAYAEEADYVYIGGYPIGAKLLSEMADDGRLSPADAETAMMFCYGSGPAFAAGVAGISIFGDMRFGLAALLANLSANLTLYIVYMIFSKKQNAKNPSQYKGFSTGLIADSVSSATGAMAGICSMILFFAALKAVLESVFPQIINMKYFASVLEISNIGALSARQGVSLIAVTMLLGFGGLCVHMQLFAIINGRFRMGRFYLSRLIALPLAGGYAFLIERIMYNLGIVSTAATKIRLSQSRSLIPIICVAAMVFITLREKSKQCDL